MSPAYAKRVAALAVSRFGADRARVREELRRVATGDHEAEQFLSILVHKKLIPSQKARELQRLLKPIARPRKSAPEIQRRAPEDLRFLGEYRILRRLGDGGMGAVYLAYHAGENRQVAVKVLSDSLAHHAVLVDHFHRESKSSATMSHPHVVRGLTFGRDKPTGKYFLVREFVDGCSGLALLEHLGRIPLGAAVQIVLDCAKALAYLHGRDLVHRDIKPDNILMTSSGLAKIADLGLLKRRTDSWPNYRVAHGIGTPIYMSPEQAVNANRVDDRSDVYSLGVTFYQLLTGQVPFPGDNVDQTRGFQKEGAFRPVGSLELDAIISKMLAFDPDDRHQSAVELINELEQTGLAKPAGEFPEVARMLQGPDQCPPHDPSTQFTQPDIELRAATKKMPVPGERLLQPHSSQ